MDIFMRNVPYSVNDKQLTRKFTEILHGPDYREFRTSGAPFNFRVYLFNKRGQFGHKGCGLLNLHSEHVGRKFLRQYGGPFAIPFFIGGRRLEFKESDKPPRADVVHELNSLSYRDPDVVEAEERTKAEFSSGTVRVQAIQFGWECREPGVFSAEYEKTCPGRGYLRFQDEPREIRIKMDAADGMADTRIVAISSNQINYVSVGFVDSQPIIFFSLQRAPIYESEAPPMTTSLDELGLDFLFPQLFRPPPQRRRHSSFDEEHLATASYTSLAIRLVCSADRDLNTFRSLCRTASLHIHERPPRVELRGLFSAPVRIRFAAWLRALPWEVAYEVERITRRLSVDLVEMLSLRDEIARLNLDHIRMGALLREFGSEVRDLFYQNQNSEYVEGVAQCFLRCKKEFNQREIKPPRISRDQDDIFDCYHVLVTPSSYQLQGPFPERLNRVIRKYIEHSQCFIRVSFCDENQLMYRFDRDVNGAQFIKDRVRSSLNGLTIAGQDIEFLAYSQSALKEHSVWYIRPFFDLKAARIVNASRIIDDLGNFHNLVYDRAMSRCPARYAARISQSFTATDSSISTTVEEVFHIDDIERNGSCFTDGVGTISSLMADEICGALYNRARRRRRPLVKPRAFQVRFQGAKGMLSVDYRLKKREVYLRRSMIKFDAPDSNVIEIAQAFERPSRYYLNRPLIMLLEGVGVPYEVFEAYQDAAVRDAQNAMLSLNRTARLLEGHGLGTSFRIPSVLQHLEKIGVDAIPDPVFGRMQEFAVHHVLREMKHKARIPVPGGWILVGVADVHDYLEPRDIFACTRCPDCRKDIYFEGPTLVSRSPTIHPGDVQVLNAIGRPPAGSPFAHEPLKNCVVFSTKGERAIPSFLGGGDLDGDTYNVWSQSCICKCTPQWADLRNQSLLPRMENQEPGSYAAAPKKLVDHLCNMEDVKDFFTDYITSDVLGMVAINWLLVADYSSQGIFDEDCFKLAQVHSDAVDYPKSGQPVAHESIPRLQRKARPDWHAPETVDPASDKFYKSERAIGRLFRAVDLPALAEVAKARRRQRRQMQEGDERTVQEIFEDINSLDPLQSDFDPIQIEVERHVQSSGYMSPDPISMVEVQDAWDLFQSCVGQIHSACVAHTLSQSRNAMLTEQELLIGTIVAKSSQPRKRKDTMAKMREVTAVTVRDARDELKGDDESTHDDWLRRSYVAWRLANLEEETFGAKSFWWIALGSIFDAMRAIDEEEKRYDYV